MDQSQPPTIATQETPVSSLPVEESQTKIDQLGLVQSTLQEAPSPSLVTGIAILIAQMQSLEIHPDFTLSLSIGIGSYRRTAEFHNGAWQGHDLTHHFDDHRSHLGYGEPNRLPMEQQRRPQTNLTQAPAISSTTAPESARDCQSTQPPPTQQFTCLLPTVPPPILTLPPSSAPISVRRLEENNKLMLPSSFRGEGVEEAHTSAQNAENATQDTNQRPRTIMMRNPLDVPIMTDMIGFQDSYDALLPSTSQDPHHLIGFQADPERQEQQKKQELAERQAAKAPIDLRDVLNRKEQSKIEQLVQKKRARGLANSDATNSSPNPSPVQQLEP